MCTVLPHPKLLDGPLSSLLIYFVKLKTRKNNCNVFLGDKNEEKEKEMKQEFGQTCDWIKKRLGDKVAGVRISSRLSSSPCVLVAGKFGWSANMEK